MPRSTYLYGSGDRSGFAGFSIGFSIGFVFLGNAFSDRCERFTGTTLIELAAAAFLVVCDTSSLRMVRGESNSSVPLDMEIDQLEF